MVLSHALSLRRRVFRRRGAGQPEEQTMTANAQVAQKLRTLIYCRVCERFTWHGGDGEPWQLGGKRLVLWHCEVCGDTASEEAS
jgi:hypothetical protein